MSESQRELFEAAVIARLKESGFLEIEIRTECLIRCGDGYQDELINAGWHYWNAALASPAEAGAQGDHETTFEIPSDLLEKVNAIRDKYRLQLGFQMAEELCEIGLSTHLCFHVAVLEHRVAAARLAVLGCAVEKREPRRDLFVQRAGEDLDDAQAWLAQMQAEGADATALPSTEATHG